MSRRGDSQQRRWSAWGWGLLVLLAALSFSACLSDVVIPPCLMKSDCPAGGAGGDEGGPSNGAGKGGSAGKGGDQLDGGAGQTPAGGTGAELAGAGQAGEGPEPCECSIVPSHLTPACAGKPYQTTLTVSGGRAPYSWQLTPQLEGWSIAIRPDHPNDVVLRADRAPLEATEVTVVVTDARKAQRTLTFPLEVRTSCWFAYTSLEETGPELHLVDPLVEEAEPATLVHASGAYDFQFSPDGVFLAYRYGVDALHPKGRYLSLLDLTNLQEHAIGFGEDQVISYGWAANSEVLAAAFEKSGKTYLGGVRMPSPGSTASPPTLTNTVASIESDLYWVGNDYVAFHSPTGKRRTPFYSEFGSAGFASPQELLRSFAVGVAVQSTATGFFLITPDDTFYSDLSDGVWSGIEHLTIDLVAPSGRYTASLTPAGLPQLFPAETGRSDTVVEPLDDTRTCTQLLAWATEQERIACVADISNQGGGTHGEIRIFDVHGGDSAWLDATTLEGFCPGDPNDTGAESCLFKRQGYSFGSVQAAGAARAFSRSGRYFAFARTLSERVFVYFADLDAEPARIAQPKAFPTTGAPSPLAFAFSPDERFLLVRGGPSLVLIEPETGYQTTLGGTLAEAAPCSESFPAAPAAYCGNTKQPSAPAWAGDSRTLAFRTNEGLTIIDLSPFPSKGVTVRAAAACAAQCSGQFGFQP